MVKHNRKLQEIAGSLLVSLPKGWTQQMKLEKGSEVEVSISSNGIINITPKPALKTEKEITIMGNDGANSVFLSAYLSGAGIIHMRLEHADKKGKRKMKRIGERRREIKNETIEKLMNFIRQNLLSTELLYSDDRTLKFKVYSAEGLGIEESFRRMFQITLSMFDDILTNSELLEEKDMQLKDVQVGRFYNLLIRTVRIFLSEGAYAIQSPGLLRAVDFRMAAEKVERIGDVLKHVASDKKICKIAGKQTDNQIMEQCRQVYQDAVYAFLKSDVSRAIEVRETALNLKKRIAGKITKVSGSSVSSGSSDIRASTAAACMPMYRELEQISEYSADIANLCSVDLDQN